MMLHIGVDVDDVLFPWSQLAHAACERAGITNGQAHTTWAMEENYGCTRQEVWRVLTAEYRAGMLTSAPPIKGTVEILAELQMMGHQVNLVTARGGEPGTGFGRFVRAMTNQWLAEWEVPHDTLTFTKDKASVYNDYFVDDSIPNVTALRAAGIEAYLLTTNHNGADLALPRVATLYDFYRIVRDESIVMDLADLDVQVGENW